MWAGPSRRAHSLLEMLVTVTVFAMAAATVAPMFGNDARLRLMAAANILASDIELAQTMTISFPNEPVVVRFDVDEHRYWLAYASAPDEPLTRATSDEAYIVTFGEGRAASANGVTMTLDQLPDGTLAFDSSGALTDFSTTPRIQLELAGGAITISIAPMTGSVSEFDGTIAELEKK